MNTGDDAEEIRTALSSPTPNEVNTGIRDKRWFVSGKNATVFYLLDTSTLPPSPVHTTTVHIVERFRVRRGLIHEIEAIFWIAPGATGGGFGVAGAAGRVLHSLPAVSPAPEPDETGWCRKSSDRCAIRAAKSYLVALPTRDYRKTQLHPHVRRTQNGDTTAVDADGVRRNGQDPHPDAVISGVRDLRWFVTGHGRARQVISFSLADTSTLSARPRRTPEPSTSPTASRSCAG